MGAHVLVDEVYLDAVYTDTPNSSFHLGPEFVVTNSLTKIYGLSGLRCGWILAEPDLARAMWRLNDLVRIDPGAPGRTAERRGPGESRSDPANAQEKSSKRIAPAAAISGHQRAVSAPRTEFGTTAILRLANGNVDDFLSRLRTEYETSAVPGRFFGLPHHFRIGMGVDTEMFREGLERIGRALDTFQ